MRVASIFWNFFVSNVLVFFPSEILHKVWVGNPVFAFSWEWVGSWLDGVSFAWAKPAFNLTLHVLANRGLGPDSIKKPFQSGRNS